MGLTAGILTGASTLSQVLGQRADADAAEARGRYEGGQYDINAGLAAAQAADALERGHAAARLSGQRTASLRGAQRAAAAASGIAVDVGSGLDIAADTESLGALEQLTIENNAKREAWGFTVEAQDYTSRGAMARASGKATAGGLRAASIGTLLSGAVSTYNVYKKGK